MQRNRYRLVFIFLLMAGSLEAGDLNRQLAVLHFKNVGADASSAEVVSTQLRSEFVRSTKYVVVDRERMESILRQQQISLHDCSETSCAVRIGALLNVKWIVMGTVSKLGSRYILTVDTVDVETGHICRSATRNESRLEDFLAHFQGIVGELVPDREMASGIADPDPVAARETDSVRTKPVRTPEGFVHVAPGSFRMGSDNGDGDEKPVHTVQISTGFYILKTEVTQKQWESVMGNNPSHFKSPDRPVENVSWMDAVTYCNRRSEKDGFRPCYWINGETVTLDQSGNGYRLPTEAEWEYAARGGNKSRDYEYSGSNDVSEVAWYQDNSGGMTQVVGTKKENELGLYDMSGNVWEWCWDWYGDYPAGDVTDPSGPSSGSNRVFRGGCWGSTAVGCRSAFRGRGSPGIRGSDLGFRVVRLSGQ